MTDKKKHLMMTALIVLMMAAMMILSTGCVGKTEDFVETESGWTIEEDGHYTYACIIKNISEEKIISSASVVTNGLDAEGNIMAKLPDFQHDEFMIGPIMPGGKVAVSFDRFYSEEPTLKAWETTPAAFSFNVNLKKLSGLQDKEAESIPDIRIASAELTHNDSDFVTYEIVLENNGEEDVNVDLTDIEGSMISIIAVCRDGDGNITGGCTGDIETEDGIINIPAGEKAEYTVWFSSLPEGEPELILNPF